VRNRSGGAADCCCAQAGDIGLFFFWIGAGMQRTSFVSVRTRNDLPTHRSDMADFFGPVQAW